jgi:hypothetical protein
MAPCKHCALMCPQPADLTLLVPPPFCPLRTPPPPLPAPSGVQVHQLVLQPGVSYSCLKGMVSSHVLPSILT